MIPFCRLYIHWNGVNLPLYVTFRTNRTTKVRYIESYTIFLRKAISTIQTRDLLLMTQPLVTTFTTRINEPISSTKITLPLNQNRPSNPTKSTIRYAKPFAIHYIHKKNRITKVGFIEPYTMFLQEVVSTTQTRDLLIMTQPLVIVFKTQINEPISSTKTTLPLNQTTHQTLQKAQFDILNLPLYVIFRKNRITKIRYIEPYTIYYH